MFYKKRCNWNTYIKPKIKQVKISQYADDSNFFPKNQESVIKYHNFLKL